MSNRYYRGSRRYSRRRRMRVRNSRRLALFIVAIVIIAALVVGAIYVFGQPKGTGKNPGTSPSQQESAIASETVGASESVSMEPQYETPRAIEDTKPSVLGIETALQIDGEAATSYKSKDTINFPDGSDYTKLEGIITFRGNNYRNTASYGTADIVEKKFDTDYWEFHTGSVAKSEGSGAWTGNGWTGQPLIVKWPDDTKQVMNLYDDKKDKSGLVEVIYASLDGKVHFLDLDDGSKTRDDVNIGYAFKGAGSLDPRGYPILYVGAGDDKANNEGHARAFIYSLIDGSKLFEYGEKDPFALRIWHAYDSAPLLDADNDTLYEPGENGILYSYKLNTDYDPKSGKISINPSREIKMHYSTNRSSEQSYWLGMEDSAVIWKHYMYEADNGGNLMCIDLNTMKLVWAQDVLDDTNGSPVFEEDPETGKCYIYISTSLHWTADEKKQGGIPIFKIDATTGEIVWRSADYPCNTVEGVSGGVQATCVVGQNNISDLVIFPVARTPDVGDGKLVALDKTTGKEVWSLTMKHYAWSSPVAVYDENGDAYIVQCDSAGNMFLIDGREGKVLDTINLGANIEASPAVYGNTVVVGTRGQKICGIKIK